MTNKNTYVRKDDPEPSRRVQLLQEGVSTIETGAAYFGGLNLTEKLFETVMADRLVSIMGIPSGDFKADSPISYDIASIAEYSSSIVLADLKSDFPFVMGWRMHLHSYSTSLLVNAVTLAVLVDPRTFREDGSLAGEMLLWYKDFVAELLTM